MPDRFILTAITLDPAVIRAADEAGVDRIGIDIERLGKTLRQRHKPGARISDHQLDDLASVAANVARAEVFVRLNPLHQGSRAEIDRALELGARVAMLPFFTEPREAACFVEMLGGRAKAVLLIETASAAARIRETVAVKGVAEIMVGLNDLHMSLGLSNPFEVVISDVLATIAMHVRDAGLRFGFGGLARSGDRTLPVPPDLVYAQYPRLGATTAWLARSFYRGIEPREIPAEVRRVRERLAYWSTQTLELLDGQREELAATLRALGGSGL